MQPVNPFLLSLLALASNAVLAQSQSDSQSQNYSQHAAQCVAQLDGKLPNFIPSDFTFSGNVRTYYIRAEEVTWDYAPTGWDNWLGVPFNDSPRAQAAGYTKSSGSYGSRWQKALYKGYTDSTFTSLSPQPSWQGINGPTLRAEVGDMIQILFVNALSQNYASMHSMGLSYSKEYEGSLYPNTTSGGSPPASPGDAVAPGNCFVYKWLVNEGAAPYPGTQSQLWGYHSYVNMATDLNSGLAGPTIVYTRGGMNKTMATHREFTLLYETFDESMSFLAATNKAMYGGSGKNASMGMPVQLVNPYSGNSSFWKPQLRNMPTVSLSTASAPSFFSLNGRVFGNLDPFEMCTDDKVIWYIFAYGGASHVFHMHGNGFNYHGNNMAAKNINDGNMATLQMNATATGIWQVLCHVSNHLSSGMENNYVVYPRGACPLPGLEG